MESLPIELVERILGFCTADQFTVCARVCTTWLAAVRNVERTTRDFWREKCFEEIPRALLEDLTFGHVFPFKSPLKCKTIYKKWFRGRQMARRHPRVLTSGHDFGSSFNRHHNISALALSGHVLFTGHLSGRVSLHVFGQPPISLADHRDVVTDLALVNLVAEERFHFLGSFSNHHHVISVGKDSAIYISVIGTQKSRPFEIRSSRGRHFLQVRVCRDFFAASAKDTQDISLFRLTLDSLEEALRPQLVSTISLRDVFSSAHWFGLFNFQDLKFSVSNCHSSDTDSIAVFHVVEHVPNTWSPIETKEISFEAEEEVHVGALTGFAFGDSIFFMLTTHRQTLFTLDGRSFAVCPLEFCLPKSDHVTSIALFGSVLVCGTNYGSVFGHFCPELSRLKKLDEFEPILALKVSESAITKICLSDSGFEPILGLATAHHVFLVKWPKEGARSHCHKLCNKAIVSS